MTTVILICWGWLTDYWFCRFFKALQHFERWTHSYCWLVSLTWHDGHDCYFSFHLLSLCWLEWWWVSAVPEWFQNAWFLSWSCYFYWLWLWLTLNDFWCWCWLFSRPWQQLPLSAALTCDSVKWWMTFWFVSLTRLHWLADWQWCDYEDALRLTANDAEEKLEGAGKESLIHHQWSEEIDQWRRRFHFSFNRPRWLWQWWLTEWARSRSQSRFESVWPRSPSVSFFVHLCPPRPCDIDSVTGWLPLWSW